MHSWRVLILPYIDHVSLYREYRFDEPWDGPNNRKLSSRIVIWGNYSFYHCPSDQPTWGEMDPTMTSYVAVVGPDSVWNGGCCVDEIADGPDKTLMVVEVANSGINWMEPRDLHVSQMAPTINAKAGQGISSRHVGGAHAATAADGVHFLRETFSPATLRALLTRNGGEEILEGDF